ncbi:MAG: PorV/PorQ family protein [candidate division KSB1 bacterium]|nr:PorV/PorQ family protein [candidate division KSB1 bacterium]
MKRKLVILFIFMGLLLFTWHDVWAKKKKVGQSGMTYLAISMGARESALGDAGTAIVKGINGIWHNPSVLADIKRLAVSFNQVNWLVDTRVYGVAAAYSLGNWGTVGMDVTYMDFGEIIGTRRVDKTLDYRGFIITGTIGVEDYAIGFAYARRINDKFALGFKIKRLHESLGTARYVSMVENEGTENEIKHYTEKEWKLDDWGLDFGTVYNVGWKNLTFAMTLQNFSRDMKYWYEEFQLPMSLRMGLAMKVSELFLPNNENVVVNFAIDAIHPNDYTERIHLGSELVYMKKFALRAGYKFNHDVESFTLGLGTHFELAGLVTTLDYAYTSTYFFKDVSRFSIQFAF